VQAFVRPWKSTGIGVYGYANINDNRSFVGVSLAVMGTH
jgi:hypothetical protein